MAAAEQTPAWPGIPGAVRGGDVAAAGADPAGDHRRGRADGRPVRAAPGHLRRLHGLGPVAGLHRGLHPRTQVLPRYANTHTESSGTGLATTRLREDARRIIRDAVGGTADDLVIFCGSGATAAVNKLIGILELRIPAGLDERYSARRTGSRRPNGRWCSSARTSTTPTSCPGASPSPRWWSSARTPTATSTWPTWQRQLARYAQRPLLIGSFSAASNVTGILTDTSAVGALLHAHGALSFWDYAAAGPYVPIRVSESRPGAGDHKDAVFLSPHKFPGGPQTPGVLVVRRDLVRNVVPTAPGGGTVAFVDPIGHRYLEDPVAREEGGTPAIVESIRAGLVFALKQAVGTDLIAAREQQLWRHVLRRWASIPGIEVLGSSPSRAAVHHLVPHPPRRPVPAPQLRRRAAE